MSGFVPPPYPYDRLNEFKPYGDNFPGGLIDLSVGTPFDPPPSSVVAALQSSDGARAYPPSIGTVELRQAISRWFARNFGVQVGIDECAAAIGTKEFVASVAQWMKLRTPERDTVLYPAVSYPSYAMGATLAGCRAVAVDICADGTLDLESIAPADAERALLLWVNSPSNPTGQLDDLEAAATWGRRHGVPVFSDECYVEFTWTGRGYTILEHGLDGVVAVHSLSKRSNLAGARIGFYAGDPDLVEYLSEVRKHAGMMVPGPTQAAAIVALDDHDHVEQQRERYSGRLATAARVLGRWTGRDIEVPSGGFYLWFAVDDEWAFTERLAREAGALVAPGEFYGTGGAGHVRVAVVQPDERIELLAQRLQR